MSHLHYCNYPSSKRNRFSHFPKCILTFLGPKFRLFKHYHSVFKSLKNSHLQRCNNSSLKKRNRFSHFPKCILPPFLRENSNFEWSWNTVILFCFKCLNFSAKSGQNPKNQSFFLSCKIRLFEWFWNTVISFQMFEFS